MKFNCSKNDIMGCQVGQIGLAYSAATSFPGSLFFPSPGAGARETLVGAGHFVSQNLEDFKLMADERSPPLSFWLQGIQMKFRDSLGLRGSCRVSIHREIGRAHV